MIEMLSSVFHISEEISDAKRKGPQILNATVIVGGITGMFCLLSLLFCLSDIEAGLNTAYGSVDRELDSIAPTLIAFAAAGCPLHRSAWTPRDRKLRRPCSSSYRLYYYATVLEDVN
jgi:hypothetical protein